MTSFKYIFVNLGFGNLFWVLKRHVLAASAVALLQISKCSDSLPGSTHRPMDVLPCNKTTIITRLSAIKYAQRFPLILMSWVPSQGFLFF